MKKYLISAVLVMALTALVLGSFSCCVPSPAKPSCAQPGETSAEGNRRHIRNARIDQQGLMQDWDLFWLTDKPSTLSDKRVMP